jgi:hypothetical protein
MMDGAALRECVRACVRAVPVGAFKEDRHGQASWWKSGTVRWKVEFPEPIR